MLTADSSIPRCLQSGEETIKQPVAAFAPNLARLRDGEALAQFRSVIACEPEAVDAPEAQREASEPVPVRVVIDLDGGLVRNVLSSVPLEYLVFDRDIEGCPEQDVAVRPGLHEGDVQVYRSGYYGADVDSDRIALIYSSLEVSEDASLDAVQPSLGNAQR